jgi:hypothetical protein
LNNLIKCINVFNHEKWHENEYICQKFTHTDTDKNDEIKMNIYVKYIHKNNDHACQKSIRISNIHHKIEYLFMWWGISERSYRLSIVRAIIIDVLNPKLDSSSRLLIKEMSYKSI